MKKLLFAILFLWVVMSSFIAMADTIYDATTPKVIQFSGLSWDLTKDELDIKLKEMGVGEINHRRSCGEDSSFYSSSSSYGDGEIIKVNYSKIVPTIEITYDNSHCVIAGYNVSSITVKSMGRDMLKSNQHYYSKEYDPYEIIVNFGSNEYITRDEQFDDLLSKMSSLYGEPYLYQSTVDLSSYGYGTYEHSYAIWIGANDTSAYLEKSAPTGGNRQYASVLVSLHYGLSNSNILFDEYENAYQLENDIKSKAAKERIANDISGL